MVIDSRAKKTEPSKSLLDWQYGKNHGRYLGVSRDSFRIDERRSESRSVAEKEQVYLQGCDGDNDEIRFKLGKVKVRKLHYKYRETKIMSIENRWDERDKTNDQSTLTLDRISWESWGLSPSLCLAVEWHRVTITVTENHHILSFHGFAQHMNQILRLNTVSFSRRFFFVF